MLFSKRRKVLQRAIGWCHENGVPDNGFNIVTALDSLGLIREEDFNKILFSASCINCGSTGNSFEFDDEKQGEYCVRCGSRKE